MEMVAQNKSKRRKKGKSKISFDEELVTKDHAQKLVSEEKELVLDLKENENSQSKTKKGIKRKKNKEPANTNEQQNDSKKAVNTNKKKQTSIDSSKDNDEKTDQDMEDSQNLNTIGKKQESIRALKRKKHAQIIEDKKIKVELKLQQNALNYLSKWKHSKSEWKFEKLKQVWLQQSLFDKSKVPDEFWETAVQYFSGAKGHSRQAVLDLAIKYIEDEEKSAEDNKADEDYQVKLKRARDIVQNLE